ncbi:MAG TPA: selenide, water dikinase SelD [Longimicrobiales bacterium]|nr:selenide, water dikinase SelD [Longimicrobiales bacterium]
MTNPKPPTGTSDPIRLSQLSHGAGCACKLGSAELSRVLSSLVPYADPAVLIDASTSDDAAVYLIDDNRALIATVDFFTSIVDDPYDFGRIAAANALSDVYAMGARPRFALSLVAFPRDLLGRGILEEIVRGGGDIALEAGIAVIGGHSVDDAEPKFGMCVIGEADPALITRNSGARPGDVLVLTKPIGTGVIATAIKRGLAPEGAVRDAVASMTTLNRGAAEAMLRVGVAAATDVTGFGLLVHLRHMLRASGVAATIDAGAVPLLPGTAELAAAGCISGGTRRNLEDVSPDVAWDESLSELQRLLLCDAQTSGGLLIAVPAARADRLVHELIAELAPIAAVVGHVREGRPGALTVTA